MRKVRLELDSLAVESFVPVAAAPERGTVRAHDSGHSCDVPCATPRPTEDPAADTCAATCARESCAWSCEASTCGCSGVSGSMTPSVCVLCPPDTA